MSSTASATPGKARRVLVEAPVPVPAPVPAVAVSSSSSSSSSSATTTTTTKTAPTPVAVAAGGAAVVPLQETRTRGMPVSGRGWKVVQTKRFSSMKRPNSRLMPKGRAFRVSILKKKQETLTKELTNQLRTEIKADKDAAKGKRDAKRKRKAEGALRSAQTQVINPEKIRRMNKKQLRQVRRTMVNKDGVVELVGAYQ